MNITIDKNNITIGEYPTVKKEVSEFKKRYTDNDLARVAEEALEEKYQEVTGEMFPYFSKIIFTDVKAFAYDSWHGTYFRIDVYVESYMEICIIHYYTNLDLEVDAEARWNQFEGKYNYTFGIRRYELREETDRIIYTDVAV